MTKKKYSTKNPNPVDKYIGARIRFRRNLLGMSQDALANALGITFQQVQKYENATNRVGGSRLWDIASVMGIKSMDFFYDGIKLDPKDASCDLNVVVDSAKKDLPDHITKDVKESKLIGKIQRLSDINRRLIITLVNALNKV